MICVSAPVHICSPSSSWAPCSVLATLPEEWWAQRYLICMNIMERGNYIEGRGPFYIAGCQRLQNGLLLLHTQESLERDQLTYLMNVLAMRKASAWTLLNIRRPKCEWQIHRKLISLHYFVLSALHGMTSLNAESCLQVLTNLHSSLAAQHSLAVFKARWYGAWTNLI